MRTNECQLTDPTPGAPDTPPPHTQLPHLPPLASSPAKTLRLHAGHSLPRLQPLWVSSVDPAPCSQVQSHFRSDNLQTGGRVTCTGSLLR